MATHISFDDEIAIEQFCSMFAVLIILKCAIFENKNQEDSGFLEYSKRQLEAIIYIYII